MGTEILISQLDDSAVLTKEQLKQIAGLIYDTDLYIYPALFGKRKNAMELIPAMLGNGKDNMFRLQNIYVATLSGRIVGLILWKNGRFRWKPEVLQDTAKKLRVELSEYLDYVSEAYMNKYDLKECGGNISLINMCVAEEMRGMGIGTRLLHDFVKGHIGMNIRLCVLKSNKNAVKMYQSCGFTVIKEYQGFSVESLKPDCFEMLLDHKKQ